MKRIFISLIIIFLCPLVIANVFKSNPIENLEEITIKVMFEDETIEEINLEEYLIGVLAGEMPVSFPLEALKAQAVASRSYVLYQKEHSNKEYDVYTTTTSQVYKSDESLRMAWSDDYDKNIEKIKQAVNETKNEVMIYDEKIINALFFSTAPGYTENSEDVFSSALPYLRSVESNWDLNVPSYKSKKEFTLNEFKNKLNIDSCSNVKVKERTNTGRIKSLIIDNVTFDSMDIRTKLGLRSTYFDFDIVGDKIIFTTYGYGHGVGMSQYGAKYMALEGYSYKEILNHYYSDIKIVKNV